MRVLITGATGFVGRRLSAALNAEGHEVLGLSRDPQRAAAANPNVSRFFAWQTDALPPAEAIDMADAVVNLAGETVNGRWTAEKKRRILDSRVVGTRNLVAALARSASPKVLVSASAVGYYGDRGDEVLKETSAPGKGFLSEVTQAWEAEAQEAQSAGHRVVIMRLGIILGPEGGAMPKLLPLFRFGLGGPIADGKQWWPWVHVDDVTGAIAYALRSEIAGTFNLTAPTPARQADFAKALGAAMHRPALLPAPGFALRLIQGEFADEILFSKRVLPAALMGEGFAFRYPALPQALEQLLRKEGRFEAVPTRA